MIEHCERCKQPLNNSAIVWLELNSTTGKFQTQGAKPLRSEHSQGLFAFGLRCAAKPNKPYGR